MQTHGNGVNGVLDGETTLGAGDSAEKTDAAVPTKRKG